jgi:hypothetical protein
MISLLISLQNKNDAPTAKANILNNATTVGAAEVWIENEIVANGFVSFTLLRARLPNTVA